MKHLYLKIHGRVHGVFFRAAAKEKAREFGLAGWVKNSPDGCVEIAAEGKENDLKKFLEWCRIGTPASKVEKIEEKWSETAKVRFNEFKIVY